MFIERGYHIIPFSYCQLRRVNLFPAARQHAHDGAAHAALVEVDVDLERLLRLRLIPIRTLQKETHRAQEKTAARCDSFCIVWILCVRLTRSCRAGTRRGPCSWHPR